MTLLVLASFQSAVAQLVSVQCCTQRSDLDQIGLCVSGPNETERPPECNAGATCILGFGPDASLMDALCDLSRQVPTISSGFCDAWSLEDIPAQSHCVASPADGLTLFEIFDVAGEDSQHDRLHDYIADGQDGDLDAVDLNAFYASYDFVPNLVQPQARLVLVECCIPDAVISEIAECLSGPGGKTQPPNCSLEPICIAGFTAPLEPGDWLYKTCAQTVGDPAPLSMHCESWQSGDVPPAFECRTAHLSGHSLFVIADLDGDVDVDLLDFASLQREIAPK